jgi:hypothetical protein
MAVEVPLGLRKQRPFRRLGCLGPVDTRTRHVANMRTALRRLRATAVWSWIGRRARVRFLATYQEEALTTAQLGQRMSALHKQRCAVDCRSLIAGTGGGR